MSNYSYLDKELNRFFLSESSLSNYLHKRLIIKSKKINHFSNTENIFITGLARAGTTALLNRLYCSDELASLIYKYMPFILSPSLAKIFAYYNLTKAGDSFERYHQDNIFINNDSPECLDEPYWIKCTPEYYLQDHLKPLKLKDDHLRVYSYLIEKYSKIQDQKRILIKNNNHHLRIIQLAKFFTKSKFLVMFRNPVEHAFSLLNQHKNFSNLQNKDPYILEYMNLLGHFEFGLNAKPFIYSEEDKLWFLNADKNSFEYWLTQWIKTYSWILQNQIYKEDNIYLVSYESLCNDKNTFLNLLDDLNLKEINSGVAFKKSKLLDNSSLEIKDKKNLKHAENIYMSLLECTNF